MPSKSEREVTWLPGGAGLQAGRRLGFGRVRDVRRKLVGSGRKWG